MKKVIQIKGMMCEHCKKKVEDILNNLSGIKSVKVNLDKKNATIVGDIEDATITNAIKNAGYTVEGITIKKGLF